MENFIDFKRVERLSLGNNEIEVSLEQKIMKLTEEVGELSQAMLKIVGAKNVSSSAGETKEHTLEEICDCMNVLLDITNTMNFTQEEAENMFNKKLDKWERKVKIAKGEI